MTNKASEDLAPSVPGPGEDRLEYVDAAKGLAILAVVMGHVSPFAEPLYWWHIPCFYVLSGYLFKVRPQRDYVIRRFRQLVVPYLVWLILLSIPLFMFSPVQSRASFFLHILTVDLFGGRKLPAPFSAYWFLPSLFACSICLNFMRNRLDMRWCAALCAVAYSLAIVKERLIPNLSFPLEIDSILIGLPFMFLGVCFRSVSGRLQQRLLKLLAGMFALICAAYLAHVPIPKFDVKAGVYGMPILSPMIALGGTAACMLLGQLRLLIQYPLAAIGRASLIIMLLHKEVYLVFVRFDPLGWPALFFWSATIPVLLDLFFRRFKLARRILIGSI